MADESILYEVSDHVAVVTLNRPEVMNALTREMYGRLEDLFREAHRDDDVRCVILTGNGRAFCSGDDVKQIMLSDDAPATRKALRPPSGAVTPAARAIWECDKPVIAAVNGAAVGWGMDVILLCDLRIAADTAKFAELFVKRGLVADVGGMWQLPKIVGPSKAAELLMTGEVISPEEAKRIGLVSDVVPADALLARARETALKIAANPPIAVRYIKEGLRRSHNATFDQMGEYVSASLAYLFTTEDHKEGALSFVERREPEFHGR